MKLIKQSLSFFIFIQFFCLYSVTYAITLVLPAAGDVVGKVQYISAGPNETIDEIGRRFDIGYYEMVRANPQVDLKHSLAASSQIVIPSQFILPSVSRKGIVINLAEYRLYYFPENENVVLTFPVGIGRKGWITPIGITKIIAKQVNPKWSPTENLRAEALKYGDPLPDTFPSGPHNPLGKYTLRLGWPTFLIHGTNRPEGVGARVSAGCIRMLPEDIEYLFGLISVGTQVRIINEPVKIGKQDGALFLQIHPLLSEEKDLSLQSLLQKQLNIFDVAHWSSNKIIQNEIAYPSGLVRKI
ncbi:MAG: L,D-transpeptidase family protein [Legionella longbeachae]|nr:L,D-transpeptidase family protein [Legionella longbeachae]